MASLRPTLLTPPSDGAPKDQAAALTLEQRVAALEEKMTRFENAMFGAAEMLLGNAMMSAMMPKEMKKGLQDAIAERKLVRDADTAAANT